MVRAHLAVGLLDSGPRSGRYRDRPGRQVDRLGGMAAGTPNLGDGVVRLRAFLATDTSVHLAGEDEATVRFLSGGTSTLAGTRTWIATHEVGWQTGGPALVLAVEEVANGHLAGMVEARFDVTPADGVPIGAANLSYGLYPAARGRGLATRSIRLLLGELAHRGVAEAVIRVDPVNTASIALARRLGFDEVGPVTTTSGEQLRVFRTVVEPVDDGVTTIRAATANDVDALVELAAAARADQAVHQPVFWRPAADARERHRPFLAGQIADPAVISLVATDHDAVVGFAVGVLHPAPPVYDPGGPTCTIDDFTVDHPTRWATTGADLLGEVRSRAAALGAVQVVVVVGHHDHDKQAALAASGLTAASQWWTAPTGDAL